MYVAEDESEVLVSCVQVLARPNTVPKRLKLTGLDENAQYKLVQDGVIWRRVDANWIESRVPRGRFFRLAVEIKEVLQIKRYSLTAMPFFYLLDWIG